MWEIKSRVSGWMLVGVFALTNQFWGAGAALAEDEELDELARAFGWNFAAARITSEPLADGLHVLSAAARSTSRSTRTGTSIMLTATRCSGRRGPGSSRTRTRAP